MSTEENPPSKHNGHANLHIPSFLELDCHDMSQVQVVTDGAQLTAANLLKPNSEISLTRPILIQDTPESIGMQVLKYPKRKVQVRDIAKILGEAHPVDVIDVEHQSEMEGWTLGHLVDYFEDPRRHQLENAVIKPETPSPTKRRQRKAVAKTLQQRANQRPRVINQISLEFSNTPLHKQIRSPQFVRDLDWIDHAWPGRRNNGTLNNNNLVYPTVQYYCLTSAAGCYTDFHVDFGGTSVWYHVLSGQKEFCLIAPTRQNLEIFEEWNCSPTQATTFLPSLIEDKSAIIRISLQASQTMIIPAAWIHGVYTPTDSVVLGGNFLHGLDTRQQLEVYDIEDRTKVRERFRFPLYRQLHFYVGGMYLSKLRRGDISPKELEGCRILHETLTSWWEEKHFEEPPVVQAGKGPNVHAAALEAAKANNCKSVEMMLHFLKEEYNRITKNGICPNEKVVSSSEPLQQQDRPKKIKLKLKSSDNAARPPKELIEPQPAISNADPVKSSESAAAPEMPKKIRLKLNKTENTKPSGHDSSSGEEEESSDPFRIVLSAPIPKAPKPKAKRYREDTEWIDDGLEPEDEWMPSKKKPKKKATSSNNNRAKPAPKSNARSRLMKRLSR